MADGIKLEIVSPERLLLSEEVASVSVPGTEGYFTVLGEHMPLMTTLRPGFITVIRPSGSDIYYVRSGFAEVNARGVTILAEEALPIGEFDRARIDSAILIARDALAAATTDTEKSDAELIVMSLENLIMEATTYTPGGATH